MSIQPPEEVGAPYRLSAIFHDNKSEPVLEIKNNEWKANSDAFDIVTSQGKIGIRKDGKFVLKIFTFPPNKIVIEEIDMLYKGVKIQGDSKKIVFIPPYGGGLNFEREVTFTAQKTETSMLSVSTEKSGLTIGAGHMLTIPEPRPTKNVTNYRFRRNEPCPCGKGGKYKNCCKTKYDYSL